MISVKAQTVIDAHTGITVEFGHGRVLSVGVGGKRSTLFFSWDGSILRIIPEPDSVDPAEAPSGFR